MTEQLLSEVNSQVFGEEFLPVDDKLRELYELEFASLDMPTTYRLTDNYSEANVVDANEHITIEELQDFYVSYATERACEDSWWTDVSRMVREHSTEPNQADRVKMVAKHTVETLIDDSPNGQSFEVYEFGEKEEDRQAVEVVLDTLQLIDQFSGGLMSSDPNRPRIVIGNGVSLQQNHGGGEISGVASRRFVYLNMPQIREIAKEHDADFHQLLAVVTVHEVLGHALERSMKNYTGLYFGDHFDYSGTKVKGEIYK